MNITFKKLFPAGKPIIGMIHLAGERNEKVKRALEELDIYEQEGIDGAIVENYHGDKEDVKEVLKNSQGRYNNLILGVNIFNDRYLGFQLANKYGAKFIQLDSVQTSDLNVDLHGEMKKQYPNIVVLGGIGFKYTSPTGNPLEVDLREGQSRCEAIVTTGSGTGIETPLSKLREYKTLLGEFPLIVGAGVDAENAYEQLSIADGAIIGSYFKPNKNTILPVERSRVREIMDIARKVRQNN